MLTEDLYLPNTGDWIGVTPTSGELILQNGYNLDVLVRFGALSTSHGQLLASGQTLIVDTTVYVRAQKDPLQYKVGALRITR